jgi:hypothetical protein
MLFSDQINDKANLIKDKILVINKKHINLEKQSNSTQKNNSIEKDASINKEIKVNNDNVIKGNIPTSPVTSEKYKKFKMDRMNQELAQDKQEFLSQDDTKNKIYKQNNSIDGKIDGKNSSTEQSLAKHDDKDVSDTNSLLKEDVPVFKVSRSKINDTLTISDKGSLLSIASKLSAVDYEKVKKYLQGGSDEDIKNTIKLLKERLSEKDYDKVKEVVKKVINIDVVEQ